MSSFSFLIAFYSFAIPYLSATHRQSKHKVVQGSWKFLLSMTVNFYGPSTGSLRMLVKHFYRNKSSLHFGGRVEGQNKSKTK